MANLLLLIPLLPALGALLNGVRAFASPKTPKNKTVTNAIALGTTLLSALIAAYVVFTYSGSHQPWQFDYYTWIPAGMGQVPGGHLANFAIDFAFRIDPLSCTMLMIVTWIGFFSASSRTSTSSCS